LLINFFQAGSKEH